MILKTSQIQEETKEEFKVEVCDSSQEEVLFDTSFDADTPRTIPDEGPQIESSKDPKKFVINL